MVEVVVVVNIRRLDSLKSCGRPLEESLFWYIVVECREVFVGVVVYNSGLSYRVSSFVTVLTSPGEVRRMKSKIVGQLRVNDKQCRSNVVKQTQLSIYKPGR